MATTEARNNEIVENLDQDVWVDGNLERVEELLAEDFVGHSAGAPDEIHGPEEYKEFVAMTRAASSDMEVTVKDVIVEGDKVVQRVIASGTHDGTFMGIEPTGNRFELEGIDIYRLEDGEIVEGWEQADMFGLLQQLGVVEPPGP